MSLMDRGLELLTVAVVGVIPLLVPSAAHAANLVTDVQSAWRSEVEARRYYLAFAMRADEERFGQIASMFRAIAQAEAVHAAYHQQTIEKLGGSAEMPDIHPAVGSTLENLEFAVKREFQERERIYSTFLNQHEAESQELIRSFALVRAAEAKNERLCAEALQQLDKLRNSSSIILYVCPVCGYITEARTFARCPVCFGNVWHFKSIS